MLNNVNNRLEPINFEFLNGFRGLCALWVICKHSGVADSSRNDFISFIFLTGQTFAVNGFFILSSFLLTHRLLADSTKYSIILNLAMYFIRRLLRVYLVYVIFCSLIKFGPKFLGGIYNNHPDYYSSWFELITLTSIGRNHLWTIPPEIFFYFILPIILVYSLLSRKLKLLLLIQLLTIIHLNLFVNIFKLLLDSKNFHNSIHYSFMLSLPVFIQGSTLSLLFQYFDENLSQALDTFLNWHKLLRILYKPLLNILTLILISLAFESSVYNQLHRTDKSDFNYLIKPAYLWTVVLFVMLISKENENIFKDFLEKNQILKSFGKYSFGIYLWHPMCIYCESNYNNIVRNHMNRYIYIAFISYTAGFFFFHIVEKNLISLANHLCNLLKSNLKSYHRKENINIIETL